MLPAASPAFIIVLTHFLQLFFASPSSVVVVGVDVSGMPVFSAVGSCLPLVVAPLKTLIGLMKLVAVGLVLYEEVGLAFLELRAVDA